MENSKSDLRKFSIILSAILVMAFWFFDFPLQFLFLPVVSLLTGVVRPNLMAPIRQGIVWGTKPFAKTTNFVFIFVIYFGIFFPVRLAQIVLGYDALKRNSDRGAQSFWQKPAAYHRNFTQEY